MSSDTCKACFKPLVTEPVQVRYGSRYDGAPLVDSGIVRCANPECHNTTGGTLAERLAYIGGVYGYKYFGYYELSAEQSDAVHEAYAIASTVPALEAEVGRLREALTEAIEQILDLANARWSEIECPAEDLVSEFRAVLKTKEQGE